MIEELKNTYYNKKVFLTGHTGFKGAWMLKVLKMLGAQVKGYSLAPKTPNDLFQLIDGDSLCDSVISDLRDPQILNESLIEFEPDFVFHLAAQPLVRLSYQIPSETFEINAIGTAYLLDAVKNLQKACNVVLITTDKVYHNHEWIYPYRENDRLGGIDPYSASKACSELIIESYRHSFFNLEKYNEHHKALAVARAGNVIGGGDWAEDRLIPDIIRFLINDIPVEIRNPTSVRPWQHVLEPIYGYLLLGAKMNKNPIKHSQPYNFGPELNDCLQVQKIVDIAIGTWGKGSYIHKVQSDEPHESGLLKLDVCKAFSELQWFPKMNARKAIEITMDWYKMFYSNKENIGDFTTIQINDYFDV